MFYLFFTAGLRTSVCIIPSNHPDTLSIKTLTKSHINEKEDGTRESQYGRYGKLKLGNNKGFEHVIRYDDGIQADFIIASCSVPLNYDYARLNVQNYSVVGEDKNNTVAGSDVISSNGNISLRFFWDGGLLANTPLRETIEYC